MRNPRVLNCNKVGLSVPNSALVGRPSIYGNPFPLTSEKNRAVVIKKFEVWLAQPAQKWLVELAKIELRGKDLLCFCAPRLCHASIWLRIVNG